MKTLKATIFFSLLLLLLLSTEATLAFINLDVPAFDSSIIDADTKKPRLDIGTKNILVAIDIPTEIFKEEKVKVDMRVTRVGKIVFKRENQSLKDKFEDVDLERTKVNYLFSLDNPLQENDLVEMCFTLIPSGRGGCSALTISKEEPEKLPVTSGVRDVLPITSVVVVPILGVLILIGFIVYRFTKTD